MTATEFKSTFDLLYNNISSNQSPGIDDYERSVFLTKAQNDIVRAMLTNKTNKLAEGPDDSSNRQEDLRNLITFYKSFKTGTSSISLPSDGNSHSMAFPADALVILGEEAVLRGKRYAVIPLKYSEYRRLLQKPYPYPPKHQLWRLDKSRELTLKDEEYDYVTSVSIIGHYQEDFSDISYRIQYIRRPHPILVGDTSEWSGATLEGFTLEQAAIDKTKATAFQETCELPEHLHMDICIRAAELAKGYYTGNLQEMIALGNASATQVGIGTVPSKNG